MDVVRRGRPEVVAGADALSNPVRWVHVSELADIAHLLKGGELVLTTGVALPLDGAGLGGYVKDLAGVGVAGLMVELGRRFIGSLPPALARAAERAGLPLVALRKEVRFVEVTEAVHARIVDAHLEELRRSERLHAVFTDLSLEGASVAEVLRQVARLGGMPVVLEDLTHQVVAVDPAGEDPEAVLDGWEERSRAALSTERVAYAPEAGLLVARVGARGEDWGRLVLVCEEEPGGTNRMLIERATTALALGRLIERDRSGVRRQAERTLLAAILDHDVADHEVTTRTRALGVPVAGRQLVGVTARLPAGWAAGDPQALTRSLAESVAGSARRAGLPVLVGVLEEGIVTALLSLPAGAGVELALTRLAGACAEGSPAVPVIGVGSVGHTVAEARRSLRESRQVADVVREHPGTRPYHQLGDLGILGLIHLLREDPRLQSFVERQLGRLLSREARQRTGLLAALSAYLQAGGNKSTAARLAHLSRSVLYQRLSRLEEILGVSLDDPGQAVSLPVALLALEDLRATRR
jgi:purine catabolism regulator